MASTSPYGIEAKTQHNPRLIVWLCGCSLIPTNLRAIGIEMRPRKVASRKVVARYGYVENARVSPAEAGHLIAVQAKQQNVIFICHLYILDGNGVPEHLVVTIAYFQPFHGSQGFVKLRGDVGEVGVVGVMVWWCTYRLLV